MDAIDYLRNALVLMLEAIQSYYRQQSRKCIFSYTIVMEDYSKFLTNNVEK